MKCKNEQYVNIETKAIFFPSCLSGRIDNVKYITLPNTGDFCFPLTFGEQDGEIRKESTPLLGSLD